MRMNNFKNKLLNMINESGLTIEEIFYVWQDLLNEISVNYNNLLIQEQNKENNIEQKKEKTHE